MSIMGEIKTKDIAEKIDELLNTTVSLSGFTFESTNGPKIDIAGRDWFKIKDDTGEVLCLSSQKDISKTKIKARVKREAGIVYLAV